MGRGSSKAGKGGGGVVAAVQSAVNQGQLTSAGDMVNDNTDTAGYLMVENNGQTYIYGKNYNNSFSDIAPGSRGMDADGMAQTIANTKGTWSIHKFDGQVQFPASSLKKGKTGGVGFINAIKIAKAPSNVTLKKILTTPDGAYNVFEVNGANSNAMFRFVAISNK